jgi:peptidoglycan/xylan/chitin deacetylase (PgdA/CDA1 family)
MVLFLFLFFRPAIACVVLLYHHFSDSTPQSTSISPALFEQHLQYIQNNNFKVLTVSNLIKKLKNNEKLPNKCVVLTADDAYTSIAKNAYPLLKKYQIPMSVFVATTGSDKNYNALMSYPQMRAINDIIDFYNHSTDHAHFYTLSTQEAKENIRQAQDTLFKELGTQEKIFAYPYGEFDTKTYTLLKEMGFVAFGQHSGAIGNSSDVVRLPRFPMTNTYGKMSSFKNKINTLAFEFEYKKPISQIVDTNPPTLEIKFKKKYQLNCFVAGQKTPHIAWKGNAATITARQPLPEGRTKYNCTAPSAQKGRFYWISKQWIVQ